MPAPSSSSSKSANPSGSRRARRVSGGVQIGVSRPGDGGEHGRSARRRDAGQLVEERDHVQEDDEVERAVLERKLRGVGDVEPDAAGELGRQQVSGLFDHRGRQVDPHDVGLGKPLGGEAGSLAGARCRDRGSCPARAGGGRGRRPAAPASPARSTSSQRGASRSNSARSGRRKTRHSPGLATTMRVTRRAKRRPIASRRPFTSRPRRSSARRPRSRRTSAPRSHG